MNETRFGLNEAYFTRDFSRRFRRVGIRQQCGLINTTNYVINYHIYPCQFFYCTTLCHRGVCCRRVSRFWV